MDAPYSLDIKKYVQIIVLDEKHRPLSEAVVNLETGNVTDLFTFDDLTTPDGHIPLDETGIGDWTKSVCKKIIA